MKVSVIASLIVGIHVVVVASVAMQGCTATRGPRTDIEDTTVAPPPAPTMPPTVADPVAVPPPAQPAPFKPVTVQPPAPPKPASAAAQPKVHVVQNGEVLSKIARQYGCKTSEIKELNNIKDANKILVGQKLLIPDGSGKAPAAAPAKAAAPAAAPVAGPGEYIVQNGDALSKIAAKFGCKTKELMELNNIKDANKIRIGQKLKIPGAAPAAPAAPAVPATEAPAPAESAKPEWVAPLPAAEPAPVVEAAPAPTPAPAAPAQGETVIEMEDVLDYTVQNGDTVESIARLFVVSGADIRKLNSLPDGEDVKPGKVIKIPPTSL